MSLPHHWQKMKGELMLIGWVSGSTLLQGTSVMMSVLIFNGTSGRVRCVIAVRLLAGHQASYLHSI
eukprot:721791-Pelagomonas_calceolata.AAC.1